MNALLLKDDVGTKRLHIAEFQPTPPAALPGPLFRDTQLRILHSRWDDAQSSFVDEPRQAIVQADLIVATVVQRISDQVSAERQKLRNQWEKDEEVSTEDLRQALKRYRSLFERLLAV